MHSVTWLSNQTRFARAWHLEEDVLYTGRWATLFERFASSNPATDLLAHFEPFRPGWTHGSACRLPAERNHSGVSSCYRGRTLKTGYFMKHFGITTWPALRMSRRLAIGIVQILQAGACAHHEALVSVTCPRVNGCKMASLASSVGSTYTVAGNNKVLANVTWKNTALFQLTAHARGKLLMAHWVDTKMPGNMNPHSYEFEGTAPHNVTHLLFHPVKCEANRLCNLLNDNISTCVAHDVQAVFALAHPTRPSALNARRSYRPLRSQVLKGELIRINRARSERREAQETQGIAL